MLVFLVISSISEVQPVSREAAKELDGRVIDGELIEELKPAMRVENGSTVIEISAESEKYVPILDVITSVTGYDMDLTQLQGTEFYDLRDQELNQRIEKQRLSETEKEFWRSQEAQVSKPFVYHYHSGPANLLKSFQALGFFILLLSAVGLSGVYARETADNMNQLLLCSYYGKKELYLIKFAAGLTWILAVALFVTLAIFIPFYFVYGMEGLGEMLQLVKPLSMLPFTLGQMLGVYIVVFLLTAVLYAAVTMLLSVITQNQLAVTCGLLGYLLIDLFAELPDNFGILQKIWLLRPNAVLMNTGFSNYRLIHLAGRLFLNYQAAPVIYTVITVAAVLFGRRKYRKLQVGN
ncbi:MAG: efflux RND transporter permease subunit [Oscillospiraceae bacterium]|nr:efflux RND transporter permease subunit [Oscillospiraceae bacterium]